MWSPYQNYIPYSEKIWRALNLAKWRKKGCILILAKFKFGDLIWLVRLRIAAIFALSDFLTVQIRLHVYMSRAKDRPGCHLHFLDRWIQYWQLHMKQSKNDITTSLVC